jgi:hypothetical protein
MGIYYVSSGDLRASNDAGRLIEPGRVRLLGVICMLPLVLEFSAGVAIGIWGATSGRDVIVFVNSNLARIIEGLITVFCGLTFNSMRSSSPTLEEDPNSNPYKPPRILPLAEKPVESNGKATASLVLGLISIPGAGVSRSNGTTRRL